MCVVSMVMDHYKDRFNDFWGVRRQDATGNEPIRDLRDVFGRMTPSPEIAELRALISEFREAVAAAKHLDVLTKQPDCVGPKKATLEERVSELERQLNELRA